MGDRPVALVTGGSRGIGAAVAAAAAAAGYDVVVNFADREAAAKDVVARAQAAGAAAIAVRADVADEAGQVPAGAVNNGGVERSLASGGGDRRHLAA